MRSRFNPLAAGILATGLALIGAVNGDDWWRSRGAIAEFSQRNIAAADLYIIDRSPAETARWSQRQERLLKTFANAHVSIDDTPALHDMRAERRRLLDIGNAFQISLVPDGMRQTAALVIDKDFSRIEVDPNLSDEEIEQDLDKLLRYCGDNAVREGRYELADDGVNIQYWLPSSDPFKDKPDATSIPALRLPPMALI